MSAKRGDLARPLSEDDVRQWVGDAPLARARRYAEDERVVYPRREGLLLRAACRGSLPTPYDVEVKLGARGIEAAYCTCPVGGDGRCKHVAAVLLEWLDRPEAFSSVDDLVRGLEARPSSELAAVIVKMLRRYPDLHAFLSEPACAVPGAPPDAEQLQRSVVQAFVRGSYDAWRAGEIIAASLADLLDQVGICRAHGEWQSAVLAYRVLSTEIMHRYLSVEDEGQHLASVLVISVEGLGECLPHITDAQERRALLSHLLDLFVWNIREMDLGLDDTVRMIYLDQASSEERHWLAGQAWEAMPGGADPARIWERQDLGRLMLDLEAGHISDEDYLDICREAALSRERIARLLSLARTSEAIQVASEADDTDLLPVADLLTQAGLGEAARSLVMGREAARPDDRLLAWLKEQARANDDPVAAQDLARQLFWRLPNTERFAALRDATEPLGTWEEERARLFERLLREGHLRAAMHIALDDGDVAAALQYAEAAPLPTYSGQLTEYVAIARAAEDAHPRQAIRLYVAYAEALVRDKQRGAYAEAALTLKRVRRLYAGLGEPRALDDYIAQLRTGNRRLRALQEELDRAGL